MLGCMAERVKAGLLSQGVTSVVAGPDSYRDLPRLLASQRLTGQAAIFFCQHIFTAIKRNFVSLDFHKIGELKVDIFLFFRFFFLDLGLHFLIDHSRIYSINASERNICTKEETY